MKHLLPTYETWVHPPFMIHCLLDRALSPSLSSLGFYSFRLLSALVISPSAYFPPSIILVLSRIFFFISPLEFPSFTLDRSKVSYILSVTLWSSLLSLLTSLHIELLHFPTYVNFSFLCVFRLFFPHFSIPLSSLESSSYFTRPPSCWSPSEIHDWNVSIFVRLSYSASFLYSVLSILLF